METKSISRRDLLKSTGVLIVGFSFFGTASRVLAQGEGLSVDGMDPTVLDSWMAISKDGTVTVFTGKVELGTGVVTALAQIVAEELDVSFNKVYMDSGDTDTGSRPGSHGGRQNRRARRRATAPGIRGGAAGVAQAGVRAPRFAGGHAHRYGRRGQRGRQPLQENCLWRSSRRQAVQHKNYRRRNRLGHEGGAGSFGQEPERLQDCRKIDSACRPAGKIHG